MEAKFFQGNRKKLYDSLPDNTLLIMSAGSCVRKTADENYLFYADRSFLYMTGIEQEKTILMVEKENGNVVETLYVLPPDMLAERWTGTRLKPEEVTAISGVENIAWLGDWEEKVKALIRGGHFERVAMYLYKHDPADADTDNIKIAKKLKAWYPGIVLTDVSRQIRRQRTIKQPCEIAAIKEAAKITRDGIVAMMKASKPGMYEYQYKAEFDYALAQHGCLSPAFPVIISAGDNNFCIHYYSYKGQSKDGDMILNDVGAQYDHLFNDVSRGWPCNGKFSEKQRLLYTCAYNTSQHMFSIIKPGMKMSDVDKLSREFDSKQLAAIGLTDAIDNPGKYIWHGGAHHLGWDTHDLVDVDIIEPGMVFCVDVGIYCEEWGIGFRLEDNCHVTEDGCENLTAVVPRTIEDIEAIMSK